jgi:TPR repeat protein
LVAAAAPPTPVPAPARRKDTLAAAAVAQPPKAAAPPPALDPDKRESALKFVKRGDEELADGRVAPARLLYERAAEMGLAQAALALAATYDPAELNQPNLRNVQPDLAEAKRWYERARALGAAEAATRLQRLGAK